MHPYSNEASFRNMSVLVLCQVATNHEPPNRILREVSSHPGPAAQMFSRKKHCHRGTDDDYRAPGAEGRRSHWQPINGIRNRWGRCATARARAGANNTAPLRVNPIRAREMACGRMFRPDAQRKAKAMHARHRAQATRRNVGNSVLRNRTACGRKMAALSLPAQPR